VTAKALAPRYAAVLAFVRAHPGTTAAEVAKAAGIKTNTAGYALDILYAQRCIERRRGDSFFNGHTLWMYEAATE